MPSYPKVRWRSASAIGCGPIQSNPTALHLLHVPTQLVLQGEVPRALRRCQKLGQLSLLLLNQVDTTAIEFWQLLKQFAHARLVHAITGKQLLTQRETGGEFFVAQNPALVLDVTCDLLQLAELFVIERETLPNHVVDSRLKSTLHRGALFWNDAWWLAWLLGDESAHPASRSSALGCHV